MKTCFIVPGFGGSELVTTGEDVSLVWVSYTALALGQFGVTRLDAAGTGPGDPDGRPLAALAPLGAYYKRLQDTLQRDLSPEGYRVLAFGYDWRMDFNRAGVFLADKIEAASTTAEPCSIVSHSFGGIIARRAWAELVNRGHSNLVRRLVTLGTGHGGSYGPVTTWTGGDELVSQVAFLSGMVRGITRIGGGFELLPEWSQQRIEKLTATWVSLYQQLPVIAGLGSQGDVNRAKLFDLASWPSRLELSASHLEAAKILTGGFMRSPRSLPPSDVLTTVAGLGFPTPFRLNSGATLGTNGAIESTEEGDGRIVLDSALVPASVRYTVNVGHTDLALSPVILDVIAEWVLDERGPDVPPVEEIGGLLVQPALVSGPPWTGGQLLDVDC